MALVRQKITIVKIRKPPSHSINDELQYFGNSLGLFGMRDKDKSCFRIFVELLKSAKRKRPLSSDELAYRLGLSRGTVVHHINKLKNSGIVIYDEGRYYLRVDKLEDLIKEIKRDLLRTIDDLSEIAKEIDEQLGM